MTLSSPCRASASRIVITALVVLPSIVIATRGRPSSLRRRCPWCSMPAIAAATLSKIVVLIGFSPRMSMTECTTITSRVPTSGPKRRCPDAIGVTMILGMPIGSDSIALAPRTAPSAPPRQSTPSSRRSRNRLSASRCSPSSMPCTASPRLPAWRRRLDRLAAEPRDFGARHVGHDVERPGQDAGVRHDRRQAERLQPIAQVRDLRPLGVEGPNQQNGCHGTRCTSGASCSSRRRATCRTRRRACCCRGPR